MMKFLSSFLHEIAHRLYASLEPEQQRQLNTRLIQAAQQEPAFRQAINQFIQALYQDNKHQDHSYYRDHVKNASHPMVCYEDQYQRMLGIYDPRVLSLKKDGVPAKVALGSMVNELLGYLSQRVLLAAMPRHQFPMADELNQIMADPVHQLDTRESAIKQLYAVIQQSQVFTLADLDLVFPDELIQEVIENMDAYRNLTEYIDAEITFSEKNG